MLSLPFSFLFYLVLIFRCVLAFISYIRTHLRISLRSPRSCIYNCRTVYHIVNALNCILDEVHDSESESTHLKSAGPRTLTRDVTRNALDANANLTQTCCLTHNVVIMHKSSRKADVEIKVHSGLKYPHRLSLWDTFLLAIRRAHDVCSQIQI
jgi:hypothetical protein